MIFGPFLVLVVLFARGGLLGMGKDLVRRLSPWVSPCCSSSSCARRFGGLVVTDDVTLDVMPGELHAIIGPNGAGKTTLINQISGLLASDSGRILLRRPRHHRACPRMRVRRLGVARSFQITSMLSGFSALENVALAVQARTGSSFRFVGRVAR